ncbi:concanavalin A-like lectin/glucanase domain-containing protein [Endogone sp. FLAS-F59071]|nr:concanavalin A-like lectin/glucanase domain-containing protein [Endogone sp. FLAS-F59071]|eukprot:RUS16508.1 concanavalin A-like lectin/glucanase domain-containing protein [Endogone sp. FLAS-F59071]
MKSILFAAAALLAAGTNVAAFCGDWDHQTKGSYSVSNNLWGSGAPASGSQCTQIHSFENNILSWETTWSWAVPPQYSVKSYANVGLNFSPTKLSDLRSIPAMWDWTSKDYTSSVYDVSFDTFLAATSNGAHTIEVMVWVAAVGGARLIGNSISTASSGTCTRAPMETRPFTPSWPYPP